jgi:hypothetical protein
VSEEALPPYQRTPLSKDCWWLTDSEKGEQMYYTNSENQLDKYEATLLPLVNLSLTFSPFAPLPVLFMHPQKLIPRLSS